MRRSKFTRWLTPFLVLSMVPSALGAIAFDSYFSSAASTDANDITTACTPVGTPRGVLACALQYGTITDNVAGMTYGGTAMTEVTLSPLLKSATEQGAVHCFFLGASVPTGAQNHVVDRSGTTSMIVSIVLLTASTDTEVVDTTTIQSDATDVPSGTLSLSSRTSFAAVAFNTGISDATAATPLSSWTARMELDQGSGGSGFYTYDTIGTSDVTFGWTQTSDDANGLGVAVSEIVASAPTVSTTAISAVTATTATGGGNVTADGGSSVTARGVCWDTTTAPTLADTCTTNGTGTGSFTSSLTGLTGSTTYYVRAYGTNSTGTGYGNEVTFLTRSASDTMATARVNSGPAPLFVHFDVFNDNDVTLDSDNGSGDPDPSSGYWLWNFGDHGAGAWATTNKSKNTATGMVAGHVYEWPGTYVASLKHWTAAGALTTYTETITVTDPDDVYTTTLYYSSTGLDANACTIASPCLTATQALGTDATKGLFGADGPRRVLFKRGESFDKTSTSTISSLTGPFHAGTYGDDLAADPIINVSDGADGLLFDNTVTGVRFVDLDFRGPAINFGLTDADFALDDASWTEGALWTVGSGVATGATAITDLSQNAEDMTVGQNYETTFSVKTFTSGTVQLLLGTGAGTARGSVQAFTETISCATDTTVRFRGAGFIGTIDDLYIGTSRTGIRIPNDSLFLRCAVDRFSSAFSVSDAHGLRSGTGIVDCTLGSNLTSYGIYWALGYQSAILGTTITTNNLYNNEHLIRQYISHGAISHNHLVGGGRGKTCMRMAGYYATGGGLTNETFTGSLTGWTNGGNWSSSSNTALHTAGSTAVLSQTVSNGGTALPRAFTFTVAGCTTGSVTLRYGGTSGTARCEATATTFTEDINPGSGALLEFVPDVGGLFDGSVDFTATSSILHMDTLRGTDEPTEWLEYTWVTDNILDPSDDLTFVAGTSGVGTPFMYGVTNTGDAQYARNCVVERNQINVGTGNQAAIESDAANYFTYRNNVVDMSSDAASIGIRIRRSGASSLTATGNQALNNTIYSSASFSGTGISAAAAPSADDSIVRNTHLIKNGGAGAAVSPAATDSDTTVTDTATDTATTGALASALSDFRPSATSNARGVGFANAAAAANYCRDAYDRTTFFTTRNDAGAFEMGFTVSAPATVGNAVGFNADDLEYDSTDIAFVDLMQMSGNTSSPYGWDTVDDGTFGANTGEVWDMVDVDGWPKVTVPFDAGDGLAVLRKRFRSPTTGTHTIYFDGAGTLVFTGAATATVTTTGSTITVDTANTDIILDLTVTNVSNLIKNIKCILPGHTATYTTAPYYPTRTTKMAAIARTGQRTVFRAMNWRRTNGDKPEAASGTAAADERPWSRRTTLTKHTQGSSFGVAWEHCARVANAIGGDLWINIPHQASEAYIRSLAQLLLGEMSSTASLWVEFSNEAWNGGFDQKAYLETLGNTTGFSGTATAKGRKQYVKSSLDAFRIFQTEWGEANSGRLYFVLGSQASSTTVTTDVADYSDDVTLDSIPMNPDGTKVHAFAIAPYFGLDASGDRFGDVGVTEGWYLTDTAAQGVARIPTSFRPLSYTFMTDQAAAIATLAGTASKPYTGAIMVAYEAGPNLTSSGANQGDGDLTTFLQGVMRNSDFYPVSRDYINNWWSSGGKLIVWFDFAGAWTGTNMYGALEHVDAAPSTAPKYQALTESGDGWKIRRAVRFPFFRGFRGRR